MVVVDSSVVVGAAFAAVVVAAAVVADALLLLSLLQAAAVPTRASRPKAQPKRRIVDWRDVCGRIGTILASRAPLNPVTLTTSQVAAIGSEGFTTGMVGR